MEGAATSNTLALVFGIGHTVKQPLPQCRSGQRQPIIIATVSTAARRRHGYGYERRCRAPDVDQSSSHTTAGLGSIGGINGSISKVHALLPTSRLSVSVRDAPTSIVPQARPRLLIDPHHHSVIAQ